ncbi:MAG: hypothetical protein COC10_13545 [Sphingobium sp.]|nr:MAG: hypothetical protein COC10_13545 [Sphingobium sp.]
MRPIALNRKNAPFAGHDAGTANWGVIASLIETCKLNNVAPHAYLADTFTAIVAGLTLWQRGESTASLTIHNCLCMEYFGILSGQ